MLVVDRRPLRLGGVLLALAGCTEPFPVQQFAPMRALCGEPEGPIRLMSVADHERIAARTVRAGDRWVAEIDVYAGDAVSPSSLPGLPDPETHLVSVDACGEDRQTLATKLFWTRRSGVGEASVWLGCERQTHELLWIEPTAPVPRRSLGPSGDPMDPFAAFEPQTSLSECGRWLRIDRHIWVERPDIAGLPSIAHLSVPADGGDPIEHEVLDARWIDGRAPDDLDDGPPELFVRVGTEVRALDLPSGTEEVLLEVDPLQDVRVIQGRYIRITDLASTALQIVDRDTGRMLEGEVAGPDGGNTGQGWSSVAGLMLRSTGNSATVVWLPELELQELAGPWAQPHRLDDGRLVLAQPLADSIHVLDGPGATPRLVVDDLHRYYGVVNDAILGLVGSPEDPLDLVSFPLDGSGPRVLARNVDGVQAVIGDRWATMRDETADGAELLLVDADGTDLGRVDTHTAARFGPTYAQDAGRFDPVPWLAWVVDRRGRRGLYYAELE